MKWWKKYRDWYDFKEYHLCLGDFMDDHGIFTNPSWLQKRWKGFTRPIRIHWCELTQWIKSLQCRWLDHDWIVDGYANGDSGAEWRECRRCGKSWHHTYY